MPRIKLIEDDGKETEFKVKRNPHLDITDFLNKKVIIINRKCYEIVKEEKGGKDGF